MLGYIGEQRKHKVRLAKLPHHFARTCPSANAQHTPRPSPTFLDPPTRLASIFRTQLWVEDDETFAADPHVALPWGMSGLSLAHIASLAHSLRLSLEKRAEEGRGGTTPAADLAHTVRAWLLSEMAEGRGEGLREEIPPTWTDVINGYVEILCRAIATGTNGDNVPWRR